MPPIKSKLADTRLHHIDKNSPIPLFEDEAFREQWLM